MMNIIRADLYRLFRGKGFYITGVIFLIFIILQAFQADNLSVGVATDVTWKALEMFEVTDLKGSNIHILMFQFANNLPYFVLPFIIFIAAADFSSGSIKNVLSNGTSRIKYYFSKLILCYIFSTIMMILYLLIPIIFLTISKGFGGNFDGKYLSSVCKPFFGQLFILLAITSVGVFFVFLTKRIAGVNSAFIAFCLAPTLIIAILSETLKQESLMDLLAYDMLIGIQYVGNISTNLVEQSDINRCFIIAAGYLLLSVVGSILVFRKNEIK